MDRIHRKVGVLALFTLGPCSDNTSEAKSTRTRASSHLLCGHRRSIVSLSSRRVSHCTSLRGATTSTYIVYDSTCVVGLCIRRAPSTDGEGNMESCWDRVKYILRSAGCAPCDGDTHSHSFFFVHEGVLSPSNCSKLRTEQSTGQNSDSLCLYVLFMCVGDFQQFTGQGFHCCSYETRNRLFAKAEPNIRIQFKHPVCSTITRAILFANGRVRVRSKTK